MFDNLTVRCPEGGMGENSRRNYGRYKRASRVKSAVKGVVCVHYYIVGRYRLEKNVIIFVHFFLHFK